MELFFACLILLSILVVIYLSLCKLFMAMLMATGMSKRAAKFQVFSCLGATGFTTKESELIMIDNTRRKIITALMVTGYIFSILISSALIGIILNLDFKSGKDAIYFKRLGISLGISIGILLVFIILTRIGPLKRATFEFIKYLLYRNVINKKNKIIFHDVIGDKYLASIKVVYIPDNLRGVSVGNLDLFGVKVLSVNINDKIYTDNLNKINICDDCEIELFGTVDNIVNLFNK